MRGVMVRTMALIAGVLVAGCQGNGAKSSTDVHLDKIRAMHCRSHHYERQMVDNAVQADMLLAEFHFVPHSQELSGSGVKQLDRMAPVLDAYGGTIRYAGQVGNDELVEQRFAHVREYLAMTGCNMDRVTIEAGLPGGGGMDARRALKKQDRIDNPPMQGGGPAMISVAGQ